MGQQQIMLIVLGVLIIGIAIAVAVALFGAQSVSANKDGVTATLVSISADACQYRMRPGTLGGGGNTFLGYTVPHKLMSDENGIRYVTGTIVSTSCQIIGVSAVNTDWVATCVVDDTGKTSITYTGW